MPERVLIDNDVVLKVSCYGLVDEMLMATTVGGVSPSLLSVARFVIRAKLSKTRSVADKAKAMSAFERLFAAMGAVEPNDAELLVAADLEAEAIRRNLELDGGESQLLAVLASRGCHLLLTGDKRAISAISSIASEIAASRIACLEQLICQLVVVAGVARVRPAVCAEPLIDRAITACFECSRTAPLKEAEVVEGLASYVRYLDRAAPGVLLPGVDLARLAA